jgi:CheY-like chemotaxis protein
VEINDFSIKRCFQEIKNSYNSAALKKKIEFIIEVDESLPEQIRGCERAITQILRNLVDNAIKFTVQGWVRLTAETVCDKDKKVILFTVKDTGIGIAESDLPHLFQPFAQVDSSYSRRFDGTGIGLSICNRLVELIGSKLIVSSMLGSGTEFSFSVNSNGSAGEQKTTMEKQNPKDPADLVLNEEFASFYPMKILIAEDNVLNQKLMHKMLQKLGYEPDIVGNGEEAFKAVCATSYRLLLMDIQMPKMDGFAATRLIIQEVAAENRPTIIALTAAVSSDVRQSCLDAGMKAFIPKPIGMRKLAEILQKYY